MITHTYPNLFSVTMIELLELSREQNFALALSCARDCQKINQNIESVLDEIESWLQGETVEVKVEKGDYVQNCIKSVVDCIYGNSINGAINACEWAGLAFARFNKSSFSGKYEEYKSWAFCFQVKTDINPEIKFIDRRILKDYLFDHQDYYFNGNVFMGIPIRYVKIFGNTIEEAIENVMKHPFATRYLKVF